MAVHHIRPEADDRKGRKGGLGEKGKFFQIVVPVAVRLVSAEIAFIINKIKCNPFVHILQYSHITALP